MNDSLLLETVTTLGYRLAMAGAETYRVEETISMILRTYGFEAEVYAIPNCLTVSILTADGTPMTRMRRIGIHGNDLDSVERYNNLSRAICNRKPPAEDLPKWLEYVESTKVHYSLLQNSIGHFLGGFGFALFFGGNFADGVGAGVCGLLVMVTNLWMERLKATQFFRTITAAFLSAMLAYSLHAFGLIANADATIIGTLMLLVPGLLFTNAMRDVMYGDTNSGLNRIVQVLLIAVAIALGTAAALQITQSIWGTPIGSGLAAYGPWMLNLACLLGCIGFAIQFNIHGVGVGLCALGGVLSWSAYMVAVHFTGNVVLGNLIGGIAAAIYSEVMARIRHFPAISYLVVSIFPLIPGAGVYYTMDYAVQGEMGAMASKGFETAAIAGAIALGILLISTAFRIWSAHRMRKQAKA